ncbi:MAG: hypothetical protein UU25_C0015G0008 [Microgenomates group bacterium GW2011_GWB1_40_9]|nr:MAG: hypothetical protein UT26_C0022G0030 [Microgenomates group bacterium GW2011_GWC1_39_12]KKR79380.1 MAG: hypothetical protein UU25_C0015G0008 [Microgenomates group bacterium GW2011_GWB1_40_9]
MSSFDWYNIFMAEALGPRFRGWLPLEAKNASRLWIPDETELIHITTGADTDVYTTPEWKYVWKVFKKRSVSFGMVQTYRNLTDTVRTHVHEVPGAISSGYTVYVADVTPILQVGFDERINRLVSLSPFVPGVTATQLQYLAEDLHVPVVFPGIDEEEMDRFRRIAESDIRYPLGEYVDGIQGAFEVMGLPVKIGAVNQKLRVSEEHMITVEITDVLASIATSLR